MTAIPGRAVRTIADLDTVDFAKGGGVVTVVAQHAVNGRVLMVAFADREALERTLETGTMWYRSRSRGLWHKGETSGNTQAVIELRIDCDGDAVLALVEPRGPACHTGAVTCFGEPANDAFAHLDATIAERRAHPGAGSYTAKLLSDRNLRLKKLGEEAAELAVACADGDTARATEEAADMFYHAAVALHASDSSLEAVRQVLALRARPTARGDAARPD